MKISIQFFGHYRDAYPEPLSLELPDGATVQTLSDLLEEQDSRLRNLPRTCRFAVNEAYATLDTPLPEDAVIGVLPPMSGG